MKKNLGLLHQALDDAVKSDLIDRNPADLVAPPPLATDNEQRALTKQEIVSLLRAARGTRFADPIRFTLATGLRRGELLGVRWDDLDLGDGRLDVRQSAVFVLGKPEFHEPKSKSRRSITLSPETVKLLRAHRVAQSERRLASAVAWEHPELVFPSTVGTIWNARRFYADYCDLIEAAEIPEPETITWHTLRHTAASQWIAGGASVFEVARRLGHASIATTERVYAHLLPRQDSIAAHALDHLIAL